LGVAAAVGGTTAARVRRRRRGEARGLRKRRRPHSRPRPRPLPGGGRGGQLRAAPRLHAGAAEGEEALVALGPAQLRAPVPVVDHLATPGDDDGVYPLHQERVDRQGAAQTLLRGDGRRRRREAEGEKGSRVTAAPSHGADASVSLVTSTRGRPLAGGGGGG